MAKNCFTVYGCLFYPSWFTDGSAENIFLNARSIHCIDDVCNAFENAGIRASISPLHDKDVYERDDLNKGVRKGDLKKPHYHILIENAHQCALSTFIKQIDFLPIKYYVGMQDEKGAYDYLSHDSLHCEDKAHYPASDIIDVLGGVPHEPTSEGCSQVIEGIKALTAFADDNMLVNYDDLCFALVCADDASLLSAFFGLNYTQARFLQGFVNSPRRYREINDCTGHYCLNGFVKGDFPDE